ncbi:copper resistance CopC family protein [Cellulomonas humilata]|uniref:Methionine-rich copper-binding protein CopC n=1 Tax=Cellulomonas humilata TaxID=144055 RepID=A0ABU0ECD0_9CELL|nr:copper resistance CopC family protein [Cellulomonas humilata]MDQ0372914.1 methionine-rich copper-binding protein CopC [Cellulomonas humilata]
MTRLLGGLVTLTLALAAVVLGAPAAQAHNVLQSTDPADGSTVQVIPEMVTLTFNEPVLMVGTEIMVHTADETMVNIGPPILVDNTAGIAVTGELPAGEYTVIYRVTSADGHPIEGQFRFTAAEATSYGVATDAPTMTPSPTTSAEVRASESAAPSPSPTPTEAPVAEGRVSGAALVAIVAVLVVVGAVVAWLLLRRRPTGSSTDPPAGGVPGS